MHLKNSLLNMKKIVVRWHFTNYGFLAFSRFQNLMMGNKSCRNYKLFFISSTIVSSKLMMMPLNTSLLEFDILKKIIRVEYSFSNTRILQELYSTHTQKFFLRWEFGRHTLAFIVVYCSKNSYFLRDTFKLLVKWEIPAF